MIASLPSQLPKWQDSHSASLLERASCHFSCQNGRIQAARRPKIAYPADNSATLRDSSDRGIDRIAETKLNWKEEEKLSSIVDLKALKKNNYNISPSRYIHTSDAETYWPIAETADELKAIEEEARETDKALRGILEKIEA